jgi:hypothetical protein
LIFKKIVGVEEGTQRAVAAKNTRLQTLRTFILFLAELQDNLFDDFSYPAWPWILNTGLSFKELTLFVFEGQPLNVPDVASKVRARNAGVGLWPMFCIEAAENPAAFYYQQK